VIRANEWSLVQVADQWVTFTGRARVLPSGEERAITVIVDRADPLAANRRAAVVVDVEGVYHLAGSMEPARVQIGQRRQVKAESSHPR
jgi:hypothetical protein